MKFEDALAAMRAGKKVRRKGWINHFRLQNDCIINACGSSLSAIAGKLILATDWDIVPDPEPEPQWLLLEPGMTIREGDEMYSPSTGEWSDSLLAGDRVDRGIFRRRIAK